MAWEDRNGRQYYYRKRREGGHVISEYVGGGRAGEIAATLDSLDQWDAEKKRIGFIEVKASAAAIDSRIREAERYTQVITRAVLLVSGYHAPRRQWRKRRG